MCSTSRFLASTSPWAQRARYSCSSARLRGLGKESPGAMRSISRMLFIRRINAVSTIISPPFILFTPCFSSFPALRQRGIVRGMPGSPIIQDGKLIGAVTHVLVNDPTTGYEIFIENMLAAAG